MPEPARRRRLLILAICCTSLFIAGLGAAIVVLGVTSTRTRQDQHVSSIA